MAESVDGSPVVSKRSKDAEEESERSSFVVPDISKQLIKRSSSSWNWLGVIPRLKESNKEKLPSFLQKNEELREILRGIYRFTFEEIKAATNDFDDDNIIGKGWYFKTTYKGIHPRLNQIAVKHFTPRKNLFCDLPNEIHVSSRLRHRNITSFLGYCTHKENFMLIYKYEENGSLHRRLFNEGEELLNWSTRCKICLEIANGLAYLHKESGMRIIHRGIQPLNILLNADLSPKIGNFFISVPMSDDITHSIKLPSGTLGYLDPEYWRTNQVTEKVDVYNYGVVILDIVSGKRVFTDIPTGPEMNENYQLKQLHETLKEQGNLLQYVDRRLGSDYSEEEALTLLKLSALCTKLPSSLRPSIPTVVRVLEGNLKVEELIHEQWEDDYEQDFPFLSEKEINDTETNDDVCTASPMSEVNIMLTNITTGDTAPENIKNNEDSSNDEKSSLDDDFHNLHVASDDDIDTLFSAIDAIQIPEELDGPGDTPSSSSSSVPTTKVVIAFDGLKNIVLRNNLKTALNEDSKSNILHLCEILDGFDLSETHSGLVHRVKDALDFTSALSSIQMEDSLYMKKYESAKLKVKETKDKAKKLHHEATILCAYKAFAESDIDNIMNKKAKLYKELAKLDDEVSAIKMRRVDDEKKLVEIRKVLASDTHEITQLAKWLDVELENKVTADKRIKHTKECLEKAQENWRQIQVGLW